MKKTLLSMAKGTIVLTMAGMAARVLGFFFKQYLTMQIGSEGMGLIQLTMPLLALVQAVYSGGLATTVASMVASNLGTARPTTARALAVGAGSGILVAAAVWAGAPFLAACMGDGRLTESISILAMSIPVIGMSAAVKGYYMGLQRMRYPALAQVVEQVTRIGISYALVASLWDGAQLAQATMLCTLGTALGEMAGWLAVFLPYLWGSRQCAPALAVTTSATDSAATTSSPIPAQANGGLTRHLLLRCLPSSAGKLAASLLTVIETAIVPVALVRSGMTGAQGLSTLGLVEGIAMPLIMLPGMVCTSLSSVAVPAISATSGDKQERQIRVGICLQIALVMGFVMAGIFRGYADLVAYVTYPNSNVGHIIYGLAPCCIFAYPMFTLAGTMQALRLQKRQLFNTLLGYVLRIGMYWFLAGRFGLRGYVMSLIISYGVICLLDIFRVTAYTDLRMGILSWSWLPGLCYVGLVVTSKGLSAIICTIAQGSRLMILAMVALVGMVAFLVASGRLWCQLFRGGTGVGDSGE